MEVDMLLAQSQAGAANGQTGSCLIRYLETRFPLELFLYLTDFMEDNSLLRLRLACRSLEQALLPTFQTRFFTKRYICLNEQSLNRFSAVSEDPRFGPQVSSVSLSCIHSLGTGIDHDEATLFIDCGYDLSILTHALSNMPSVQDVTVNYGRSFSPLNASHNVAAALARETPRKVLRKLLRALADSGRELKSFNMDSHGGTGGGFLLYDLNLGQSLAESLSRPLRTVKKLGLALDPIPENTRWPTRSYVSDLVKFLGIPQELKHLRLNLDRDALQPTYVVLQTLISATPSPFVHLTQLDIGKMTTTVATLVALIRSAAKNLTELQLFRIGLMFDLRNDYPPDLSDPQPTGETHCFEAALWKIVFEKLAVMPELERLTRFYAGFLTERSRKDHVSFRRTLPAGENQMKNPECRYNGAGAREFLQTCSENAIILIEHVHRAPSSETDEDASEDNSDDGTTGAVIPLTTSSDNSEDSE